MTRKERVLVVLICLGVSAVVLLGVWSLLPPERPAQPRMPRSTHPQPGGGGPVQEPDAADPAFLPPTLSIDVEVTDEQYTGGSIEGMVVDENGTGLFAVVVTAAQMRRGIRDIITDESGEYMIRGLPAGIYDVVAQREGYALAGRRGIQVFEDQVTSGIDFTLVRGGTFKGRVVDMNADPITGARIILYAADAADKLSGLIGPLRAMTDDNGEFQIEDIAPGEYHTLAQHDRYLPSERLAINVESTEPATYKFVLELGGALAGTVTDLDDNPVADARMWLSSSQEDIDFSRGARTGADGRYVLGGLTGGTVNVRVLASGFIPSSKKQIDIFKGRVTEGVDFQLDRGKAVSGVVVGPDGEPVENATVTVSDTDSYKTQKTDKNGVFAASGFAGEKVNLSARAAGYVLLIKRNVPINTHDLRLVLQKGGSVEGRAIIDAPIAPSFSVVLYSIPEGGQGRRIVKQKVFRNSDGYFKVDDIPPGRYTLEVHGMHHIQARPEIVKVTEGASVSGLEIPLQPRQRR